MLFRIGHGYDVHALAEGLPLVLGGVGIEHDKGCVAHSDGDVVIHAPAGGSPYILSFSIPGVPNAQSVRYLSDRSVFVSRASACEENHTTVAPGTWRGKHPRSLQAAGISRREGKETLRVSFFHQNTPEDVDRFVTVLAQCAREMRES